MELAEKKAKNIDWRWKCSNRRSHLGFIFLNGVPFQREVRASVTPEQKAYESLKVIILKRVV